MKAIIISLVVLSNLFTTVNAQTTIPPEADKLFIDFTKQVNTKHLAWMRATAKTMNDKKLPATDAKVLASQYAATLGSTNNMDIQALTFLVLMQASKSAQEDTKSIMAGVKEINKKKEAMRYAQETMRNKGVGISPLQLDSFKLLLSNKQTTQRIKNTSSTRPVRLDSANTIKTTTIATRQVTKAELDDTADKMKNELDSINKMEEMESMRLQTAMNSLAKMIEMLSNIMKKDNEIKSAIINNLR